VTPAPLTAQLAIFDIGLADPATTRSTLPRLAGAANALPPDATVASPDYQRFRTLSATADHSGSRAKDICTPWHRYRRRSPRRAARQT
jgi:hypothetical protein